MLFGGLLGFGNVVGGVIANYNDSKMFQLLFWLIIITSAGLLIPGLEVGLFYVIYLG